jgi:hypothetical protein
VSLEAGAKVQTLFSTGKKNVKFFLEIFISVYFSFLISVSRNFNHLASPNSYSRSNHPNSIFYRFSGVQM